MKEQRRVKTRSNYSRLALVSSSTGETIKGIVRDVGTESICLDIEPVFSYFPSYKLDGDNTSQDEVSTQTFNSSKKTAAFQGDLSVITIENLMQMVGHAGLSGELQLATPDNSAILVICKGTLIYGFLEKNPMKIGQMLIQGNYITSEHLQECLSQYKSEFPRPKIGKILVEKGYLQQDDLEKAIKEQIKAIVFEVLSWKKGSFTFSTKKIPSGEGIFLEERIDHLILAGIVHLDNLTWSPMAGTD